MGAINKLFGKYLFLTNVGTCGVAMAVGDIICQHIEYFKQHRKGGETKYFKLELLSNQMKFMERGDQINRKIEVINVKEKSCKHDYQRINNMMCSGFMQGSFLHYFYKILDQVLPGKSTSVLLKKIVLDQSIASPSLILIFFVGMGFMENQSLQEIVNEIQLKFLKTLKMDICFWPPIQLLNFIFIPARFRVVYLNTMTVIYDILLSYIKFENAVNSQTLQIYQHQ